MTTLRLNRMHHPVTVLGFGVRAGIWLQGCSIGCAGCASRDTWDAAGGSVVAVTALVDWLDTLPEPLDGLTVSGGEPFDQAGPLAALLDAFDEWRNGRSSRADVLVYSGYPWSRLRATPSFAVALGLCDAVVAGPYVDRRNTGAPLRGSDNQRIMTLSELGRSRYADPAALPQRRMQTVVDETGLRLVGLPRRGDLERLRAHLQEHGVELGATTWQS